MNNECWQTDTEDSIEMNKKLQKERDSAGKELFAPSLGNHNRNRQWRQFGETLLHLMSARYLSMGGSKSEGKERFSQMFKKCFKNKRRNSQ